MLKFDKQNDAGRTVPMAYFWIHAMVEFVCFGCVCRYMGSQFIYTALIYDFFAFVPQAVFGVFIEKSRFIGIRWDAIGVAAMAAGVVLMMPGIGLPYAGIVIMAIGNAIIHECGAVATVMVSEGRMFPSALFVAGGSFGLVCGQTMASYCKDEMLNCCVMLLVIAVMALLMFCTDYGWLKTWREQAKAQEGLNDRGPETNYHQFKQSSPDFKQPDSDFQYPEFRLINPKCSFTLIFFVAFGVTFARSFIGYAIPISWKKALWQSFFLFFMMGAGKAFGGWCVDRFGARKTGVLTTLLAVPFLICGKEIMVLSIIGVFLFSMTMSITFGMLLGIMRENPGIAFGVTTIGLFLGLCPIFLFGSFSTMVNMVLVVVLSLLSALALGFTLENRNVS